MIYKTTSSGVVIAKIYRDFKPENSNWIGDALEMIGEAIILIGRHVGLEAVKTPTGRPISVVNHRAEYPSCMEGLYGVEYRIATTGDFRKLSLGADTSGYGISCDDPTVASDALVGDYQYYQTNVNYIYTSFESGQILLHYKRVPLDSEELPLILDSVKYRTALTWYIMSKLILNQTIKHPDPKIDYQFADAMWEKYMAQSQNEYKMPSIDSMERFTSMWTRLKFDSTEMDNFFKGGEIRDKRYIFDSSSGATGTSTVSSSTSEESGDEIVIFD